MLVRVPGFPVAYTITPGSGPVVNATSVRAEGVAAPDIQRSWSSVQRAYIGQCKETKAELDRSFAGTSGPVLSAPPFIVLGSCNCR